MRTPRCPAGKDTDVHLPRPGPRGARPELRVHLHLQQAEDQGGALGRDQGLSEGRDLS